MKEIGGYIELDRYTLPMLHKEAVALNCGRNCLAYLIRTRCIKKIVVPYFLCDSIREVCKKENVEVRYYCIDTDFLPFDLTLQADEWLYIVNYYGQLSNKLLKELSDRYKRVIIDNAQAYFQMPVAGVDTLYTCRKFFGVADGAFLYTNAVYTENLPQDYSYDRMHFLLGRFEKGANEFYQEYVDNNHIFQNEPIKQMSKLTHNLLRGIDYAMVSKRRTENFRVLHQLLGPMNKLTLVVPEGAFMYPLYIEGGEAIRKQLQRKKIYIPTLWPDVFEICSENELEYDMARNILPLPIDQRYTTDDMKRIAYHITNLER